MNKLSDILAAQAALAATPQVLPTNVAAPFELLELELLGIKDVDLGEFRRHVKEIKTASAKIDSALLGIADSWAKLETSLERERARAHQQLFAEVNRGINKFATNDAYSYIAQRQNWILSQSHARQVAGILGKYIEWQYPVLYVEPNNCELSRLLMPADPVYILEDYPEVTSTLLSGLPPEGGERVNVYTKTDAKKLSPTMGLTVSWNNLMFKRVGDIRKDIEMMANLTLPGGYVMFDYVDAGTVLGARAIENGWMSFMWRDRVLEFLKENDLTLVEEHEFLDSPVKMVVSQRAGTLPHTNLISKLGLVMMDESALEADRQLAEEIAVAYRALTSSLEADLKQMATADAEYAKTELTRQRDNIHRVNQARLDIALGNLANATNTLGSGHPNSLEAALYASRLAASMGRKKDARGLITRAMRDVKKLDPEHRLVKEFGAWLIELDRN